MPSYRCPECKAELRLKAEVTPGKKIKCPKCEEVFAPTAADAPKAKPKPKPAKAAAPEPKAIEDEGDGVYLAKVEEEVEKEEVHYGSLRDKYAKSQKGPAMAMVVKVCNAMIFIGVVLGFLSLVQIVVGAWPFIFAARKLSSNETTTQIVYIASGVLGFFYQCIVCWGASKMQSLESYALAYIAAILSIPNFFVGIWAIVVLNKKEVKAGFDEVAEAEIV